MKILVLNAGSSSQKSCLYELESPLSKIPLEPLWEGKIDWGQKSDIAQVKVNSHRGTLETEIATESRSEATLKMLETLWQGETKVIEAPAEIQMVGHRIVHGGEQFRDATLITPEVKAAITELCQLAPAHNPVNLAGIETIETFLPNVLQVAVFDTAFHHSLPLSAAVYPIPYKWYEEGIQRYGFHGINHQYCAKRSAQLLNQDLSKLRIISCHLGNGCSLAAIAQGQSINTTMGFTPLEGLMMGTRSGSIDPGILIHWLRQGYDAEKIDQMLNRQSGLKGVSGLSGDMRQILQEMDAGHDRAQLAFDIYIHRLQSQMGAMLASLKGLDVLIFTGGVGENSPQVRQKACEAFEFLGLKLNEKKNQESTIDQEISAEDSAIQVLVIKAQEDWEIATECWHLSQSLS
jgi:acetate kinase